MSLKETHHTAPTGLDEASSQHDPTELPGPTSPWGAEHLANPGAGETAVGAASGGHPWA